MKAWRQSKILEVVDHEAVASQEELRQKLAAKGIEATQATISRDLKTLGLVKRAGDGAYVRPGVERSSPVTQEQLRRAVAALVRKIERVGNLVVVRTDPGQAQGVAVLLDRAQMVEVAGTIAGDDTILIVCRADNAATELEGHWNEVIQA
ncbi:MAG: arginine repressor [Vicinamibacterales bacterium]